MKRNRKENNMIYQKTRDGVILMLVFIVFFTGILSISDGFTAGSSRIVRVREGRHTEEVEKLMGLKVLDTTDTQGIKNLLSSVIDDVFLFRGWNDDKEPFEAAVTEKMLQIKYHVHINRPDSFRRLTGDYSAIILALIPKIHQVQWTYQEMQDGGTLETKNIIYDWKQLKKEIFFDSEAESVVKYSNVRDFGATASSLQRLIDQLVYFDEGKIEEKKKPAVKVTEAQMKEEIEALPLTNVRSYNEITKYDNIYVESAGAFDKKEYNRELWDDFYEKVQNGEPASVIVGGYNSLENADLDKNGSVYFCNIHYDGVQFYILYDFIDSKRADDFGEGVVTGKYLLTDSDDTMTCYYVSDDCSVSWRDIGYSVVYSGLHEFTPYESITAYTVMTSWY